ncbi:hypothetical protein CNR22_23470 [Sphingobacteriaceae bacterium]|nr:hypothetical protein CNR22_23470 [Sphingobacteriaceae bacterium]
MIKKFIFLVLVYISAFTLNAQHSSNYVQYMFNGLILNPAYAGSQEALSMTGLYRKQWMGINGSPTEAMLSVHSPLKNKSISLGGNFQNSQFGLFNHTKVNLVYAYRFKFLKGHLALGLQAGIDSYSTNWDKLNITEAGDPSFVANVNRKTMPELGAGAYYHTKSFYVGLSVPNLFTGRLNPYSLTCLSSGVVVDMGKNFKVKPAVLIKYISGSPISPNFSATFYFKEIIGLGAGYTYRSSALVYTDIRVNEQLHVGYGYEYTLNDLQTYIAGSHEFMLHYIFRYKINATNVRFF